MSKLQYLYWESDRINNELFALEITLRKLQKQGKNPAKTKRKYIYLLDELRKINTQMNLCEKGRAA